MANFQKKEEYRTHPSRCAFDRVSGDDETVARVRSPNLEQFTTSTTLKHAGAGENDAGRTFCNATFGIARLRKM